MEDLEAMRDLARAASLRGGEIVRNGRLGGPVEVKGSGDYVTEVDREAERAIVGLLTEGTSEIPVVGEEQGGIAGERYWSVDPLDGTTNFVHGFPVVGVSVALIDRGHPVACAVHAPFLGETFTAALGAGAWRDRPGRAPERLKVAGREPAEAIVATGFPFRRKEELPRYLRTMTAALERFEDLRRPGAASLDLAWVAAGVFDGFFELGLSIWDVAAGGLLIQEAGGQVTDWSGGEGWLSGDVLAGPSAVHAALLEVASA